MNLHLLLEKLRVRRPRAAPPEIPPLSYKDIEYLLKGLILYKMAYIVQFYVNGKCSGEVTSLEKNHLLESMEPMGQA